MEAFTLIQHLQMGLTTITRSDVYKAGGPCCEAPEQLLTWVAWLTLPPLRGYGSGARMFIKDLARVTDGQNDRTRTLSKKP